MSIDNLGVRWSRIVREDSYYGGDVRLEWEHDDDHYSEQVRLVWKAYEGGSVALDLDHYDGELHRLRDALTELIRRTGAKPKSLRLQGPSVFAGTPTSMTTPFPLPMASMGTFQPKPSEDA